MASVRKPTNSIFWHACFRDKTGRQTNRSTKQTDRKKAQQCCRRVGEILVTHAQLKEGMLDDAATAQAVEKLGKLQRDTLRAKQRLADLRQRQRHKKQVERARLDRASAVAKGAS